MRDQTQKLARNRFLYLALAVVFFAATTMLGVFKGQSYFLQKRVHTFEEKLHRKEQDLDQHLKHLTACKRVSQWDSLMVSDQQRTDHLFEKDGLILLSYYRDSLVYWSSIAAPLSKLFSESYFQRDGLVRLQNGWYEVRVLARGPLVEVGLILLKNEYPYRNRYLQSQFHPSFGLPLTYQISHQSQEKYIDVKDYKGKFLLSLSPVQADEANGDMEGNPVAVILAVLGLICALIYLEMECKVMGRNIGSVGAGLLLVGAVLLLRHLTLRIRFPNVIYGLEVFSPNYYAASAVFPSLGDFLINAILLFYLAVVINRRVNWKNPAVKWGATAKIAVASVFLFALYLYGRFVTDLLRGLVEHSKVSLNINDFLSLNTYSYIGFLSMALLLFSFLLVADKWVSSTIPFISEGISSLGGYITEDTQKRLMICFGITSTLFIIYSHQQGTVDVAMMGWPLVVVLLVGYFKRRPEHAYTFPKLILIVLFFSLLATKILYKYNEINERKNMDYLAGVLADEPDHIGEVLFKDMEERLLKDEDLKNYFSARRKPSSVQRLKEKILQNYFSGYWEKYEIALYLFRKEDDPKLKIAQNNGQYSRNELDRKINLESKPTEVSENLFQTNSLLAQNGYIGRLVFLNDTLPSDQLGALYLTLNAKIIPKGIGYPELLIDASNSEIKKRSRLENYAYAHYKNGALIDHRGDFPYNLNMEQFLAPATRTDYFFSGGFEHVIRRQGDDLTVVSSKEKRFLEHSSLFSYQFIFLSLFAGLLTVFGFLPLKINLRALTFKNKIQLYIMVILFFALGLLGVGTIYYINLQYNTANYQNIRERIHSVLNEVESKLGDTHELSSDVEGYVTYILKRSSNIFFTDINLYDPEGNLVASSRSSLFEKGLIAPKMDPHAYAEMVIENKAEYVQEEHIGKLKYFAAYVPFRNDQNELLAYLSLPYFAKKSEIERGVQTFMATLINIYGLLLMATLVVALFVANRITKPLQMIQDKLSKIKLGRSNEPIEWKASDEIGNLVREYNRMIDELAQSVELLQKSERESAWQEMARQVAHEIKNPLTPMKLSIQHLERAWKDQAPDREERLHKFTRSMIEQIEALSTIATEFSNFAKMPKPKNEVIDLDQMLRNAVSLYDDTEASHVTYRSEADGAALVFADKDQLLRVFNNLIKNGMQSVPEEREGRIEVFLEDDGQHWLVQVKDNGSGIPRDRLDRIFVPNFTTKTGGMGLGLAMVKNIVESTQGSIWFETKEDVGTVFFVSLRKYQDS
ncbi:MAG: HAMP domain-containing protein [Flavobacteriales bacterium]|nr:HAMP domain-containing protein [Flavobacteriales bacterium]MCB9449687.1 HAMP domain-containing protein [Flavobacteriales bacterium]